MAESLVARRRRVAGLIADLYEGRRSLDEVMRNVADFDPREDPPLAELLRLVASEPANSWLFGVNGESHRQSSIRIRQLVEELAQ